MSCSFLENGSCLNVNFYHTERGTLSKVPVVNLHMRVYVEGIGGLGNILFQLGTAIWYAEKYGFQPVLISTETTLHGTSNKHGRNRSSVGYDRTIFSKFEYAALPDTRTTVHNDYTSDRIIPSTNLKIGGYCQNLDLFKDVMHAIPRYLSFEHCQKYGDLSNAICIGIRVGRDFSHMKRITQKSYVTALDLLSSRGIDTSNVLIIADVDSYWTDTKYPVRHVVEDDVTQFSIGMSCKHFILSESTFHLWIAYLGTINDSSKTVVCFNNTDITNRRLALETWTRIDP